MLDETGNYIYHHISVRAAFGIGAQRLAKLRKLFRFKLVNLKKSLPKWEDFLMSVLARYYKIVLEPYEFFRSNYSKF